jgi:hypothetical protein
MGERPNDLTLEFVGDLVLNPEAAAVLSRIVRDASARRRNDGESNVNACSGDRGAAEDGAAVTSSMRSNR